MRRVMSQYLLVSALQPRPRGWAAREDTGLEPYLKGIASGQALRGGDDNCTTYALA